MKKKQTFIIFTLMGFLTALMSSCTYTNPAFPEEIRKYFPYEEGQLLTFKNADNKTEQYNINSVFIDKEEKHPWNCKCERHDASMVFGGHKTRRIEGSVYAFAQTEHIENGLNIDISFKNMDGDSVSSFSKIIPCDPFSESVVNDIGDTIVIANELGDVTIVRNEGIIEYTIYGTKWTLVE